MEEAIQNLAPSVASSQLRSRLRTAREELKLGQREVAAKVGWSVSKVARLEKGESPIETDDLMLLLEQYRINKPDEVRRLTELGRASRKPSLAKTYRAVASAAAAELMEHEPYSSVIRQFETKVVPGILQRPAYGYPMLREITGEDPNSDAIGHRVDLRDERARLVRVPSGPKMEFIIDESALRRAVGSEGSTNGGSPNYTTMIQMLEDLKVANTVGRRLNGETISPLDNPRISIQIAPFSIGIYQAIVGSFQMLEFKRADLVDFVFVEDRDKSYILKDDPEKNEFPVQEYRRRFEALQKRCPGPELTNLIIDSIIQIMRSDLNSALEHMSR